MTKRNNSNSSTRRTFLQSSSKLAVAGAAASSLVVAQPALARTAYAGGSDTIRLGLVGAGGRGTGAAVQAMNTKYGNVELVAVADAFPNRLQNALKTCAKKHEGKVNVPEDKRHIGFDAYKRIMDDQNVNMVILTTPPGFRPSHFEACLLYTSPSPRD